MKDESWNKKNRSKSKKKRLEWKIRFLLFKKYTNDPHGEVIHKNMLREIEIWTNLGYKGKKKATLNIAKITTIASNSKINVNQYNSLNK